MILKPGDKVLAVHRRLFEMDIPRFFVGVVDEYEAGVAVVTGHSWTRDPFEGNVLAKPDPRTKVLALASGALMVYRLPENTDLGTTRFENAGDGNIWLTDGKSLRMNLRERA